MWTNLLPSKNSQLFMLIPRIYCVQNHTLIQKNHATCYSTIFKYNACKCKVTNPKIFNWNQNFDAVFNESNCTSCRLYCSTPDACSAYKVGSMKTTLRICNQALNVLLCSCIGSLSDSCQSNLVSPKFRRMPDASKSVKRLQSTFILMFKLLACMHQQACKLAEAAPRPGLVLRARVDPFIQRSPLT